MTIWPFLTGVDVEGGPGSVVALGDSITDGVKSTSGTNRRWPDVLARRFQAQHRAPPLRRAQSRHLGEPHRHRPLPGRRGQHRHRRGQRPAPAGAGCAGAALGADGGGVRGHQRRALGYFGGRGHRRAAGPRPPRPRARATGRGGHHRPLRGLPRLHRGRRRPPAGGQRLHPRQRRHLRRDAWTSTRWYAIRNGPSGCCPPTTAATISTPATRASRPSRDSVDLRSLVPGLD